VTAPRARHAAAPPTRARQRPALPWGLATSGQAAGATANRLCGCLFFVWFIDNCRKLQQSRTYIPSFEGSSEQHLSALAERGLLRGRIPCAAAGPACAPTARRTWHPSTVAPRAAAAALAATDARPAPAAARCLGRAAQAWRQAAAATPHQRSLPCRTTQHQRGKRRRMWAWTQQVCRLRARSSGCSSCSWERPAPQMLAWPAHALHQARPPSSCCS
jgi:hypothetical protein